MAMNQRPNAAQWRAARAIMEGQLPTQARIAGLLGIGVPAVSRHAIREGWACLDFRQTQVRAHYSELQKQTGRKRHREGNFD